MTLRPCRDSSALMSFPICGSSFIGLPLQEPCAVGKQNGRNRFDCLLETEGSAKPVKANKQQTAHALRREQFATYSSFTSNLPIFGLENKSVKLDVVMSVFYSIILSSFFFLFYLGKSRNYF